MPRDSQGQYSLPSVYLAVTGQTVLAEQHNTPLTDIASALTGSLPRNGSAAMQAPLQMGGYRIRNMADGTESTDAATKAQLDASATEIQQSIDDVETDLTADINTRVPNTRTITAAGLATGGGTLAADRTITVTGASQAQAEAGTDNTVVMTPLRAQQNYLANIYTGSNVNETNFPIGHVIAVNNANPSRNGAFTAYLASGSEAYVASGTTALAGTYRGRGIVTAGNCIAVRTA